MICSVLKREAHTLNLGFKGNKHYIGNVADYHPNTHLRIGGRHQLNNFVCFKSNKHTVTLRLFCSKFCVYPPLCHTKCSNNMHPIQCTKYWLRRGTTSISICLSEVQCILYLEFLSVFAKKITEMHYAFKIKQKHLFPICICKNYILILCFL